MRTPTLQYLYLQKPVTLVVIICILSVLPWMGLGDFSTKGEPREVAVATAMLGKPFSIAELLTIITQYASKEHRQQPDFSALLAFGDKRHTLERLVTETEKEMDEVRKAAKEKNMEVLDGWVHHLRSSWMLMKAEQPLQELYAAIHSNSPTDGEIVHAVQKVLAQGKLIVDLARKEIERWEE